MEAVKGLERFRRHFEEFADKYVLIGGVASLLVSEEQGLDFRATKDLDIVLCVEALDDSFLAAFWDFIRQGGYMEREIGETPRNYYRFQKPSDRSFPVMLELFSRAPDGIVAATDLHLTPIPAGVEASSLSAILMDEDYYAWVMQGRRQLNGITLVGAEHLVPLKASAYLNLSRDRTAGARVDSRDVRKHMRDVVRLTRLLTGQAAASVPDVVRADIQAFMDVFPDNFDFGEFRSSGISTAVLFRILRSTYMN